jgi:hypothetical protein
MYLWHQYCEWLAVVQWPVKVILSCTLRGHVTRYGFADIFIQLKIPVIDACYFSITHQKMRNGWCSSFTQLRVRWWFHVTVLHDYRGSALPVPVQHIGSSTFFDACIISLIFSYVHWTAKMKLSAVKGLGWVGAIFHSSVIVHHAGVRGVLWMLPVPSSR